MTSPETVTGRRRGSRATAAVLGAGVALALALGACANERRAVDPAPSDSGMADPAVQTFSGLSSDHVEGPVDYQQNPPVGGDHAAIWQDCGFSAVPVPTERAVHSMEHGAVWITYRPGLPDDEVAVLQRLAAQPYVLVSPWPGELPAPVVASSWGRQVRLQSATDPGLAEFVRRHRGRPPAPEPGAPCTGGAPTGAPG